MQGKRIHGILLSLLRTRAEGGPRTSEMTTTMCREWINGLFLEASRLMSGHVMPLFMQIHAPVCEGHSRELWSIGSLQIGWKCYSQPNSPRNAMWLWQETYYAHILHADMLWNTSQTGFLAIPFRKNADAVEVDVCLKGCIIECQRDIEMWPCWMKTSKGSGCRWDGERGGPCTYSISIMFTWKVRGT